MSGNAADPARTSEFPRSWVKLWIDAIVDWFSLPFDAFISYATLDGAERVFVQRLYEDFRSKKGRKNARIFLDTTDFDAASEITYHTFRAIRRSRCVWLVIRPFAMGSKYVHDELYWARYFNKQIWVVDVSDWYSKSVAAEKLVQREIARRQMHGLPISAHWTNVDALKGRFHTFSTLFPETQKRVLDNTPVPPGTIYDGPPAPDVVSSLDKGMSRVTGERLLTTRILGVSFLVTLITTWTYLFYSFAASTQSLIGTASLQSVGPIAPQINGTWRRPFYAWHLASALRTWSDDRSPPAERDKARDWESIARIGSAAYLNWKCGYSCPPGSIICFRDRPLSFLKSGADTTSRRYFLSTLVENEDDQLRIEDLAKQHLTNMEGTDASVCQAIVLLLGKFPNPSEEIRSLIVSSYSSHLNAGVHSAIRWTLDKWGLGKERIQLDQRLAENSSLSTFLNAKAGDKNAKQWCAVDLSATGEGNNRESARNYIITFARAQTDHAQAPQANKALIAVSTTEIPWALWRRWSPNSSLNARYDRESRIPDLSLEQRQNLPAEEVSPTEIQQVCDQLSQDYHGVRFRLPSFAEWILISFDQRSQAQSQLQAEYLWEPTVAQFESLHFTSGGISDVEGQRVPARVAEKFPNVCGFFDSIGNVREMCTVGKLVCETGLDISDKPNASSSKDWKTGVLKPDFNDVRVGFRLAVEQVPTQAN